MNLEEFLHRQVKRPHIWGRSDCGTLIGDWVQAQRGVDPCAPFRGRYSSSEGAQDHYRAWGGLARAVGRALKAVGLSMTRTPQRGDVGVVLISDSVCGALCCGRYWFTRHERGPIVVASDRVRVIAAWRV
jgi:hypothetical protein